MRADTKLNGTGAGGRSNGNLADCHNLCKATQGCTGFSFAAPVHDSKPLCWLFSGTLTEAPAAGVVSCRMPCEASPRATVLLPKVPTTIKNAPSATTLSVPARLAAPPPAPVPVPPPGPSDPKK